MLLFMPARSIYLKPPITRNYGTPASFPQFSLLPVELRLRIWELYYEEPRDVVIKYSQSATLPGVLNLQSKTPVPVLFHVCVESRNLGLKIYKTLPAVLPSASSSTASTASPPRGLRRFAAWCRSRPWRRMRFRRRKVENSVVPIYYAEHDMVLLMPRKRKDVPAFEELRPLNATEVAAVKKSRSSFGLYILLCPVDTMGVIQTPEDDVVDDWEIEEIMMTVLPEVPLLFPSTSFYYG